jgi:E3 ubiquitin-protein ligase FANCL
VPPSAFYMTTGGGTRPADHALLLLQEFPLLLPEGSHGVLHGFIQVQGHDYRVRFVPGGHHYQQHGQGGGGGGGGGGSGTLHGCPALWSALHSLGALVLLEQRLSQSQSAYEFFVELREMLERHHRAPHNAADPATPAAAQSLDSAFYMRLVGEINEVGWDCVQRVEEGMLGQLELGVELLVDTRRHPLSMRLPPDYPLSPPICSAALPAHVELRWDAGAGHSQPRLKQVIDQYVAAIHSYDALWSELELLDERAWVLEPTAPTGACTYRRLALGPSCAVGVELHLAAPRAAPECRFYGAESSVAPLRQALNANLHSWSLHRTVLDNLEACLGTRLPSAEAAAEARRAAQNTEAADTGHGAPCAICYAYRLDGAIPERVCDNGRCARSFHSACLVEWLRSSAEARTSFDTVFGTCPYCTEPIFAKLA